MEQKLVTITFSPTGGTQRVADILAENIKGNKTQEKIDLCDRTLDYDKVALTENDMAILAIPSYGGHVPMTAVERLGKIKGNSAKAVIVCVYGNRAYDDTLAELLDVSQKAGFCVIAAVAALAEHSVAREVAAGRPDAKDKEVLADMTKQIIEKLESGNMETPVVPGTVKERKASGGAVMVPAMTEDCTKCGSCALQCPVEAIDAQTWKADSKKCISCMKCISVCPVNAKKLNVVISSLGGVALGVLCKKRRENELFL